MKLEKTLKLPVVTIRVPAVTAREWNVDGGRFEVASDITEILAAHGSGIYIVQLWLARDQAAVPIAEYGIRS